MAISCMFPPVPDTLISEPLILSQPSNLRALFACILIVWMRSCLLSLLGSFNLFLPTAYHLVEPNGLKSKLFPCALISVP